jgi:hypothetical protein
MTSYTLVTSAQITCRTAIVEDKATRADEIIAKMQEAYVSDHTRSDVELIDIFRQSVAQSVSRISAFIQNRSKYPQIALDSTTAYKVEKVSKQMTKDLEKLSKYTALRKSLMTKVLASLPGFEKGRVQPTIVKIRESHGEILAGLRKIAEDNKSLVSAGEEISTYLFDLMEDIDLTKEVIDRLQTNIWNSKYKSEAQLKVEKEVLLQLDSTLENMVSISILAKGILGRIDTGISYNNRVASRIQGQTIADISVYTASADRDLNLSPMAPVKRVSFVDGIKVKTAAFKNKWRYNIKNHFGKTVILPLVLAGVLGGVGYDAYFENQMQHPQGNISYEIRPGTSAGDAVIKSTSEILSTVKSKISKKEFVPLEHAEFKNLDEVSVMKYLQEIEKNESDSIRHFENIKYLVRETQLPFNVIAEINLRLLSSLGSSETSKVRELTSSIARSGIASLLPYADQAKIVERIFATEENGADTSRAMYAAYSVAQSNKIDPQFLLTFYAHTIENLGPGETTAASRIQYSVGTILKHSDINNRDATIQDLNEMIVLMKTDANKAEKVFQIIASTLERGVPLEKVLSGAKKLLPEMSNSSGSDVSKMLWTMYGN